MRQMVLRQAVAEASLDLGGHRPQTRLDKMPVRGPVEKIRLVRALKSEALNQKSTQNSTQKIVQNNLPNHSEKL